MLVTNLLCNNSEQQRTANSKKNSKQARSATVQSAQDSRLPTVLPRSIGPWHTSNAI